MVNARLHALLRFGHIMAVGMLFLSCLGQLFMAAPAWGMENDRLYDNLPSVNNSDDEDYEDNLFKGARFPNNNRPSSTQKASLENSSKNWIDKWAARLENRGGTWFNMAGSFVAGTMVGASALHFYYHRQKLSDSLVGQFWELGDKNPGKAFLCITVGLGLSWWSYSSYSKWCLSNPESAKRWLAARISLWLLNQRDNSVNPTNKPKKPKGKKTFKKVKTTTTRGEK